jgi:hypothetical protein
MMMSSTGTVDWQCTDYWTISYTASKAGPIGLTCGPASEWGNYHIKSARSAEMTANFPGGYREMMGLLHG